MFRVFEIFKDGQKKEVKLQDNLYVVHELGSYEIWYESEYLIEKTIFIEDEYIDFKLIEFQGKNTIKTLPNRYFEDYFGFAKVSINNEFFQFNILCEKMELREIEGIILYLFEKNNGVFNKFISKSSFTGETVFDGKDYIYSSKYLKLIYQTVEMFDQLFGHFKSLPHSSLRKKYVLADYSSQTADSKSIEWLFQNLDAISFDFLNRNLPDAVDIYKNYGIIEKIGSEENIISYSTYENEIILGFFQHIQLIVSEIKNILFLKLTDNAIDDGIENSEFTDFRDLKKIPFLKFLKDLELIEDRLMKLSLRYLHLFTGVKSRNEMPRLTAIFHKSKHYQKAFEQIILFRNSQYDLSGELQLLNVRKLSELYELYNLHIIIDTLCVETQDVDTKDSIIYENNPAISKITLTKKRTNKKICFYYQPSINNAGKKIDLITIGNSKLIDKQCCPDFVIEVSVGNQIRYCILDAKYSKINTVKNQHMTSCIKKYIIDIGIKNRPYQKPDYLILLHPDSEDQEVGLIYNKDYHPQIQTIISKPGYTTSMKSIINEFIS